MKKIIILAAHGLKQINIDDIYAKIVKELWVKGEVKVNNLNIKPSLDGARKVNGFYKENKGVNNKITLNPRISPVDWITMGSLRDSENSVFKDEKPAEAGFLIYIFG